MAHASPMECHHHRRRMLLRSPSRRSPPLHPAAADERLRFLRPGALARLRDSKVIARSLRSATAMAVAVPSSPPPPPPSAAAAGEFAGGVPHFLGGVRGMMRYPLRKKLSAARSVVFLPPSPAVDAGEVFMDAFAAAPAPAPVAEMLAAH
uniref:Uncharacterized protein n=1 Tax=Leersia perrieri TaxID=77586 RepID=A0A0D9WTA3_9ORYZ